MKTQKVVLMIGVMVVSCLTTHSKPLPIFHNGPQKEDYQCPLSFQPTPALEVSGSFVDKLLASKWSNRHISVLFYASWCPFSKNARSTFEVLSNMYPQIEHISVEHASTMPSLFSRYGIRSLPVLIMVNASSLMRFHGSKDMASFIKFYKETTGFEATRYIPCNQSSSFGTGGNSILQSWIGESADEIWRREPYLSLCVVFLFLRAAAHLCPRFLHLFRVLRAFYQPHLNLGILGEARQMLGRIVHMIDVKRVRTRLNLCKSRNLRRGARNASVWASSLASLGETSRARFAS